MSWRKILIKKIWSPFLNLINSRGRLPKLKFAFYTVIKWWQQKICTPNAAWMMISTQDTKSTTIMVPNFAFKLNLHVQVDLRYNLCIHVIDSLWLTNIFLFFSTPRTDKFCWDFWRSQTNFFSATYVITTSNETRHTRKITLGHDRFYLHNIFVGLAK